MAKGRPKGQKKVGGRTKGTPNKITLDAIAELRRLGHEPIVKHVAIFNTAVKNYKRSLKIRGGWGGMGFLDQAMKANEAIMKYVYPTRKAVEHTGPNGESLFKSFTDLIVELDEDDNTEDEQE